MLSEKKRETMWLLDSAYGESTFRVRIGVFTSREAAARYAVGEFILPFIKKLKSDEPVYVRATDESGSRAYEGLAQNRHDARMVQDTLDYVAQEKWFQAVSTYNMLARYSPLSPLIFYTSAVTFFKDSV